MENPEPGDPRSADGAWVPSATIFLRAELPIVEPALARGVLTSSDAGDNGFIPMERLQHGLAEVQISLHYPSNPSTQLASAGFEVEVQCRRTRCIELQVLNKSDCGIML